MKLKLPKIIETYLEASNENEVIRFISCFTESAMVKDEREIHTGHEAIEKWFTQTREKYRFRSEPIEVEESSDQIRMVAKVTGSFPGSPVELEYHFQLKAGLIESLEIG